MSDPIKHECGIALVRLLKPFEYYHQKYGTAVYGLNTLYLFMEKQQITLQQADGQLALEKLPFIGELYLGHLRYSTTGKSGLSYVHPFLRRNNWRSRNLCLAGNFNLTNVDEILADIVAKGQHPRHNADTFIILEQIGYLLDRQVEKLYEQYSAPGLSGTELNRIIEEKLDLETILRTASGKWDGGFVIGGLTGSGDAFVFRDKWGIRPAFYYADEEIIVVASERPVIQTILNVRTEQVRELEAGQGLIGTARMERDGTLIFQPAAGRVLAQFEWEFSETLPATVAADQLTGSKSHQYQLHFAGKSLALPPWSSHQENARAITRHLHPAFWGLALPCSVEETVFYHTQNETLSYTGDQLLALARLHSRQVLYAAYPDAVLLTRKEDFSAEGDQFHYRVCYTIAADICQENAKTAED